MAWEIKNKALGIFVVAPTELQAWIMLFGFQGKHINAEMFFRLTRLHRLAGIVAVEVR
jgi:hypothetical protein